LAEHYLLVGTTDQLESFVAMVESVLPRMFKGASKLLRNSGDARHTRKTVHKEEPSEATLEAVKDTKIYKMEREFYDFAAAHFASLRRDFKQQKEMQSSLGEENFFHYEKIRPRS